MNLKIKLAIGLGALAFCFGAAAPAGAQLADPNTHYLCYKAKVDKTFANHPDAPITVVCDQFGCDANGGKNIKAKPKLFCNPASKNTGSLAGIRINDHLKCYKYKRKLPTPVHVQVSNQFGLERLFLQKTKMFCLPTEKTVIP